MRRDKTTQKGIGPDLSDDMAPPSSGARESHVQSREPQSGSVPRGTQQGLGSRQQKMSTKVGVAPPSNPPPPVERVADPERERFDDEMPTAQHSLSELSRATCGPDYEAMEEARDEATPMDNPSEREQSNRSEFKTAPGGGKNRISGGRAVASAYVSPKTVPPGKGHDHVTAAVKVLETVQEEARSYRTEPSLLRRRASSLPPPMPGRKAGAPIAWILGGLCALALAGGLTYFALPLENASNEAEKPNGKAADKPLPAESAPAMETSAPPAAAAQPAADDSPQVKEAVENKEPSPEAQPKAAKVPPGAKTRAPVPGRAPQPQAAPSPKKPTAAPESDDPWLD